MKNLWAEWPSVKRRLASREKKLLLLDFDGTLTPIKKNPADVFLAKKSKKILAQVARRKNTPVAIISGRSLSDLVARIRVDRVFYAGNHGFELRGPSGILPRGLKNHHDARRLRLAAAKLTRAFHDIPGVFVEDKGWSIAVHFRNVPGEFKTLFDRRMSFFRSRYERQPLYWKAGKKIWELRANLLWNKGVLLRQLIKRYPGYLPIAVGDDATDEDMFKAVGRSGLAIRVGRSTFHSAARYCVPGPKDVFKLLSSLG